MEVQFTPEQEAQLLQIAEQNGTGARQLVKEAALRLLHDEGQFRQGVERGISAADSGDFVESAEVWANVEKIVPYCCKFVGRHPPAKTSAAFHAGCKSLVN